MRLNNSQRLIIRWKSVFSLDDLDIGHSDVVKHQINLVDETPIKLPHRRIPPSMVDETKTQLNKMLDAGIIRPSHSPFSAPMVLIRKSGELRVCIDFRLLNKVTKKDPHALPRIEETLDSLNGAKIFTCLDLKSGYFQIEVEENHKERTAFTAGPIGFFEFNSMPFGLCNSPATFQRLMNRCMHNIEHCLIYLDDIISFDSVHENHLKNLETYLDV